MNNEEERSEEAPKMEESELETLKASLNECQDKYLRMLAESENTRKRMMKERQESSKYVIEGVVVEFLPPLDSFEKALSLAEASSSEVKNWAVGFEMILNQFKQILNNHGIASFEAVGQKFDPYLHEAVEMVEDDSVEPGTIVHEFVRGYRMGDKIIRVARVKVAKATEKE